MAVRRWRSMVALFAALAVTGPHPTRAQVPENAHVQRFGGGWACDDGFRRQGQQCVAIAKPPNAYLTGRQYGAGWSCNHGFLQTDDGGCAAIEVPENAFLAPSGDRWQCRRGFRKDKDVCEAFAVPAHGYLRDDTIGTDWECERGYAKAAESCIAIAVPEHGYLDERSSRGWRCSRGYQALNDQCLPVDVPDNAYLIDPGQGYGRAWKCEWGFRAVEQSCVAVDLPENAHLGYSGDDWDCNPPYRRSGTVCRLNQ